MAHFIERERAPDDGARHARRIHAEAQVSVGALPDDRDPELVMVLMQPTDNTRSERALRLTIAEAMILQRNLGAAIDDIQKRNDARRRTAWDRLGDA